MHPAGQRKTHNAGVVNNDHDDRERTEKVEARLAFAIGKTRINSELERSCCFSCQLMNGTKLSWRRFKANQSRCHNLLPPD
jgi:hypothetical protein